MQARRRGSHYRHDRPMGGSARRTAPARSPGQPGQHRTPRGRFGQPGKALRGDGEKPAARAARARCSQRAGPAPFCPHEAPRRPRGGPDTPQHRTPGSGWPRSRPPVTIWPRIAADIACRATAVLSPSVTNSSAQVWQARRLAGRPPATRSRHGEYQRVTASILRALRSSPSDRSVSISSDVGCSWRMA